MSSRRELLKLLALSPVLAGASSFAFAANKVKNSESLTQIITRKIPSTGELLPSIGMGSYQTFNIPEGSQQKDNLIQVLQAFFENGGKLIDSSPMYGRSELMLGELIAELKPSPQLFAASKVWTYGKQEGLAAIQETMQRMRVQPMDLMQVHNLRDWEIQLSTLNEMKQKKQLRYTGITTSRISQYEDFEKIMRSQPLDFVQLNYNMKVRDAENRLLPLAKDKGIAVIVNMPYEKGRLFQLVKGKALPEWANEIDCQSWGQFFLKFIISHPAVTCAIPATSKVHHMKDNMQALKGRLPDTKMRQKMLQHFESL